MLISLYLPFLIVLVLLIIINNALNGFNCLISFIGSLTLLSILSWKKVKCVRRYYFSQSTISSFQRAVIITGCDSGFGNRLALRLNKYGFRVYATVLDTESEGSKSLSLNAVFQNSLVVIKMDVKRDCDVSRALDIVSEDLKISGHQLWGVVNNAGIQMGGFVDWGSIESYHKVCDVNLFGAIRVTRTFLPLIRQSKGRIVNVSSISAKLSLPFVTHYSLSKASLIAFSDSLRREMSKIGVRVSIVIPASFKTPMSCAESVRMSSLKEWENTDESVKRVNDYNVELFVENVVKFMDEQASNNVDLVIDAMSDALMNKYPEESYLVADGCVTAMIVKALDYMPSELIDSFAINYSINCVNKYELEFK